MAAPCVIGSARITGDYVTFVPEAPILAVRRGEEVEIGVRFDYLEASHDRERCEIALDLERDGERARTVRVRVDDRPVLKDESLGFLAHRERFSAPGEYRLRFALRVETGRTPWLGGRVDEGASRHEGEVVVRVV